MAAWSERIPRSSGDGSSGRVEALDAVRGLALIGMVFSHGLNWFYQGTPRDLIALAGKLTVGDTATPLFFVVAGMSLHLALRSRRRKGFQRDAIRETLFNRFKTLFLLGIPVGAAWGVLQAQAVALGCLTYLALIVVPSRPTAAFRDWPFALAAAAMAIHLAIPDAVAELPLLAGWLRGDFPLFAIIALVAFGFGWATSAEQPHRVIRGVWPAAGLLSLIALLLVGFGDGIEREGMTAAYVLFGCAGTLAALGLFHIPLIRVLPVTKWIGILGRRSLFLYLAHYVIILGAAVGFGWWHALEAGAAIAAAVGLVLVTAAIGYRYPLDASTIYAWVGRLMQMGPRAESRRTPEVIPGKSLPHCYGNPYALPSRMIHLS